MEFITPNSLYLSIDQGGHASRAIIFNHEGEVVTSAYQDISPVTPAENFVEYEAEEIINSINIAIKQAINNLDSHQQKNIIAAGLATQRANIVCWNKQNGHALSPVISWQDRRNTSWLEQFNERNEYIHKLTGLFLSPHYGASKFRWCLDNLPDVKQALEDDKLCLSPMASFIAWRIVTGDEKQVYVDPVNASRTQLWNIKKACWDNELLDLFGIPASTLAECVPTIHDYGMINIETDSGLLSIPLQLVTGDQSAAMYAYGEIQADTAYINTGTGAFLSRSSGVLSLYGRRLLTSIIFQDTYQKRAENHYVLEGTVNGAGSALEWLNRKNPDDKIYDHLEQWLDDTDEPPLFLNGISGLAAPFWVPEFHSKFDRDASVSEQSVAIIESIIFLLKSCLDEMTKLSSPPEQIQLTGGLATLDILNQRLADLSGLSVYRPIDCEATARGTAYLLADQPHHWPEEDAGTWFDPEDNPGLKQRYENWLALLLQELRT